MMKPDKNEKDNDKKQQRGQRHLSGGDELLKGFLLVHECCAEISNNATPRRFIAFLHCYRQLYKRKKEGVEEKQKHLLVYMTRLLCVQQFEYLIVHLQREPVVNIFDVSTYYL